jgi:hypothetical protein
MPGHDAILKKALIESALGGSKRAESKLEALGWSKFLTAKRETRDAAKKAKKAGPKPRRRAKQSKEAGVQQESQMTELDPSDETPASRPRRGRPRKTQPESAASPAGTDANAPTTPE